MLYSKQVAHLVSMHHGGWEHATEWFGWHKYYVYMLTLTLFENSLSPSLIVLPCSLLRSLSLPPSLFPGLSLAFSAIWITHWVRSTEVTWALKYKIKHSHWPTKVWEKRSTPDVKHPFIINLCLIYVPGFSSQWFSNTLYKITLQQP